MDTLPTVAWVLCQDAPRNSPLPAATEVEEEEALMAFADLSGSELLGKSQGLGKRLAMATVGINISLEMERQGSTSFPTQR